MYPQEYTGYLQPFLAPITMLYKAGWTPKKIAEKIEPKVREYYSKYDDIDVNAYNIIYALRRIGLAPPPEDKYAPLRLKRAAKAEHWRAIRSEFLQRPPGKGRPLDMGGPRDQWIEKSPWDEI